VKKSRKLRKRGVSAGVAIVLPATERPTRGCSVELTQIEASRGGARIVAHTFALEAFGQEPELLVVLESAASLLFAEHPALELEASSSASYPSWLSKLAFAAEVAS
jgi:hypothetical protein